MPKILIDEKDYTSAGTPDSYANYAVLIPGLGGNGTDAKVLPDDNGTYEFTSAQDFVSTIGLVAPEVVRNIADDKKVTFYHYGNQMAYELLNLGYPVLYKMVDADQIAQLATKAFWEPFKDRSSYDFRFVTHGLLETTEIPYDQDGLYEEAINRLPEVEAAISALDQIADRTPMIPSEADPNQMVEDTLALTNAYKEIKQKYKGFEYQTTGEEGTDTITNIYADYMSARAGTNAELLDLNAIIDAAVDGGIGILTINGANREIANLAKYVASSSENGRGDCVALIELDERSYKEGADTKPEVRIIDAINDMSSYINADNGKYCAMTVPSVSYKMPADPKDPFKGNKKFPGAFHYLACFINSLKLGFAEWYAAAGYTRGVSSYVVDHTTVKLGEIAINALEPRYIADERTDPKFACNVIANFRGSYYLWGNRTAHPLGAKDSPTTGDLVASSFLNIRQLCITIKKQLYVACRRFTFDPNSDTLWVNFVNAIRPTLDLMKADQGIRDYKILKVYTDKKATLKAKIRIIPVEAVEDFDLEVSLEDSFGETAAVVTE